MLEAHKICLCRWRVLHDWIEIGDAVDRRRVHRTRGDFRAADAVEQRAAAAGRRPRAGRRRLDGEEAGGQRLYQLLQLLKRPLCSTSYFAAANKLACRDLP